MKKYLCFWIFVCAGLSGAEEALVVGTTSGYAPYVSLDASGRYEGFKDPKRALALRMASSLLMERERSAGLMQFSSTFRWGNRG